MIVVVGRPGLRRADARVEAGASGLAANGLAASGLVADVAASLAGMGLVTELLGSVGDDEAGDRVVLELGRAGVGHAAVLRDPAAPTPLLPAVDSDSPARLPRLEAADIELGLRYLPECRVLVLTEPLDAGPRKAALEGAAFHGAAVIAVVPEGWAVPDDLAARATVLAAQAAEPQDSAAFVSLLATYAEGLARGVDPREAFRAALAGSGWEPSGAGALS